MAQSRGNLEETRGSEGIPYILVINFTYLAVVWLYIFYSSS